MLFKYVQWSAEYQTSEYQKMPKSELTSVFEIFYIKRSRLVWISALFLDIFPNSNQLFEYQTSLEFGSLLYMGVWNMDVRKQDLFEIPKKICL